MTTIPIVKTRYCIAIPVPGISDIRLYFDSITIHGSKTRVFTTLDKAKARMFNRLDPAVNMCEMLKEWMKRDDLTVAEVY